MTVKFAARVLSETVTRNLTLFNPEASETALFYLHIDIFRLYECA